MITLSNLQKYLTAKVISSPASQRNLDIEEQQLLQWAASLPSQTESEQVKQLEKILINFTVIDMEDSLRLRLMAIVVAATDRLITTLHKYYIYELGAFDNKQAQYIKQVKSLYYLTIAVYDGIVQRESAAQKRQQLSLETSQWRQLLPAQKAPPLLLAAAIYSTLVSYKKLLYENTLFYQKPPQNMWSALNELYRLSCQYNSAHTDVSAQAVTLEVSSVHKLYSQLCLHSLLNVRAMLRPNIVLLQRLLPVWVDYVTISAEPKSDTRVFVAINSDNPPDYLTANSTIDPYDEQYDCLFIELGALAAYLEQRQQALNDSNTIEYQVISKMLMAIRHRYIERKVTIPSKVSPKQRASILTDFNTIHYQVANQQSLLNVINASALPDEQLPRYNTQPQKNTAIKTIEVQTFDSTDSQSHYRVLQLINSSEPSAKNADLPNSALPALPINSLLLLCRPDSTDKLKWSVGVVRWLDLESQSNEVEWQVLGHTVNACGLRSNNINTKTVNFVPALIIASDSDLQTDSSLLVPPHSFRSQDKVVIRMGDEEKSLRLQRCLLSTEQFSQYEFIML